MVFPPAMSLLDSGLEKQTRNSTVLACAKVNLYLEVLGARSDGYHDIRSVVVPVSLHDRLSFELTDGLIETVVKNGCDAGVCGGDLAVSDDNLATQAARVLREETGHEGGTRIFLEKEIPVGGGLGGGSSDAAVVLVELNRLWKTGLDREALVSLGARIGCDVPALVHGGAVLVEGVGEKVASVTPPEEGGEGAFRPWWLVIANPGFPVLTKDIYQRYSPPLTSAAQPITSMISALQRGDVATASEGLFNGLQETVFRKYPLIAMIADALTDAGALGVSLCGSGASVLGLARDEVHACGVVKQLEAAPDLVVWCRAVETLPDGVMVAHGPLEA